MGVYSEYLDKSFGFAELSEERKRQLKKIAQIRRRSVLVFAADLNKGRAPISINYSDLLPIQDQIDNLPDGDLDLILETPGGLGEVAEDIVRLLRSRFKNLAVIVPGWAKSAGTVIAMAADEILMGPLSALGPIDAQLSWQGKVFSADALLEGLEKIKSEVATTGNLNKAYIPILQGISPGELQDAENALKFAKVLVTEWLTKFKFKSWEKHSSNGQPVTAEERRSRAEAIAVELCNHGKWLTHGKSLKIGDLRQMKLLITDFSENVDLYDAIKRYYTLLQMTFSTNIYKIIETPDTQIVRFEVPVGGIPPQIAGQKADAVFLEMNCPKCKAPMKIQANLGKEHPVQKGCIPFPKNGKLKCTNCGTEIDLGDARRQIEAQTKNPVVS